MEASDGIAIAGVVVAVISLTVAIVSRCQALRRADKANNIARRALDIEEARLEAEERAFVQPVRFEPSGGQVVYEVLSSRALDEVEFEFRIYSGDGGLCRTPMVAAGERRFSLADFDEQSDLETPGPKEFLARARWRKADSEEWEESGMYLARKGSYGFKRVSGAN